MKISAAQLKNGLTDTILTPASISEFMIDYMLKIGYKFYDSRERKIKTDFKDLDRAIQMASVISKKIKFKTDTAVDLLGNLHDLSKCAMTALDIADVLNVSDVCISKFPFLFPSYTTLSSAYIEDFYGKKIEYSEEEVYLHYKNDIMKGLGLTDTGMSAKLFKTLFIDSELVVKVGEAVTPLDIVKMKDEYIAGKRDSYQHVQLAARQYIVSTMFLDSFIEYKLDSTIKTKSKPKNHSLYLRLFRDCERLTFPTLDEVYEKGMTLIGTKTTKGKTLVEKYVDSDFVSYQKNISYKKGEKTISYTATLKKLVDNLKDTTSLELHIDIYKRFLNDGLYFKYTDDTERYTTSLTLMPNWIRKMITLDGKELVENDFTALHNRLINKALSNSSIPELTGDSHTKLAEKFNVDRSVAKIIGLSYWNTAIRADNKTQSSKKNKVIFGKMDIWLQTEHPKFWTKLVELKNEEYVDKNGEVKNKVNNKKASELLIKMERQLMDEVTNTLVDDDAPMIYCYDCIYTTSNIKNAMERLIK